MLRSNPQLFALALLVRKFGKSIPGGYEVRVSALEITEMTQQGTLQEAPDENMGFRWQYFPNIVIDIEGTVIPESTALAKYTREEVAAMNVSEEEAQRLLRENK